MKRLRGDDVLARMADAGDDFFTLGDLVERWEVPREKARHLAFRWARRGRAVRLARGRYALLPLADWHQADRLPVDWYRAAAHIVAPDPYFLGYYTAMTLHRMTQHPLRTVFVVVEKPHKSIRRGPVTFRFVHIAPRRFFGHGDFPVEDQTIQVADLERTFMDGVDRPDLCGGLQEVFRGYARRHDDLNPDRLVKHLMTLRRPLVTKRVGFLLEAVGHGDPRLLRELEAIAPRLKRFEPLDKTRPREGEKDSRWELLVNIDRERLRQAAEA